MEAAREIRAVFVSGPSAGACWTDAVFHRSAASMRPARMTLRLSRGEFRLLTNAVDHGLSLRKLTMPQRAFGIRSSDPRCSPARALVRMVL